jgi:hypothetical protein
MKNKNKLIFVGLSIILMVLITSFGTIIVLEAQSTTKNGNSEDEEIINVVTTYWKYVEAGNFKSAEALTTKELKGLAVEIDNQIPAERWLNSYKIEYIEATIHKKTSENTCVVAVKVTRDRREFYLFHDLIKNEQGDWKILSTSY